MDETALYRAVQTLAGLTVSLPDETLDRDWSWRDHDEGLRFALIGTYHELRDLAVTLAAGRQAEGPPQSAAQRVLAQHHAAFRDLEAVLLGVGDELLDRPPSPDDWPLRRVLAHMIGAERVFFTLVYYAAERFRAGRQPAELADEDLALLFGHEEVDVEDVVGEGTVQSILAYHRSLHDRILDEFANLTGEELWALSRFWEPEPLPARYRLHRFDAHLRQHTIQVEKTLIALGHTPNEAQRLLRLVFNALAEVEGVLIGARDFGYPLVDELAEQIANRTGELATLVR